MRQHLPVQRNRVLIKECQTLNPLQMYKIFNYQGQYCPKKNKTKSKKIFNVMKISILLLMAEICSISASVYSQDAKISIRLQDVPVDEIITAIKEQTDYSFWYELKDVDLSQRVSLNAEDETVKTVLSQVLKDQDVDFTVHGNHIIIAKKGTFDTMIIQQAITITGIVTDDLGEALPGVSIQIKGTSQGTTTDADGRYTLQTSNENATLIFSYIGFSTQEIIVGNRRNIDVSLYEDTRQIDEILVIGYGVVKKSDMTGAVASISRKDMGDRQVISIGDLLVGKVAGLDVSENTIRIRGVNSLNNTEPLVLIDGFMGGSYNPDDIEHIEILKDASSTAIYGSRGANGVILITTKSGQKGPLKMTANIFTGINFRPKKMDVLTAEQYIDFATDLMNNAGSPLPANLQDPKNRVTRTDWQDEMNQIGKQHEINLGFSGGTERAVFSLSLGYRYNEGITLGSSRTNDVLIRSKNEFTLTRWLKAGLNIAAKFNTSYSGFVHIGDMLRMSPYLSVYDPDNVAGLGYSDSSVTQDGALQGNPVAYAKLWNNDRNTLDYQPNIWFKIEPFKGLVFHSQIGITGAYFQHSEWNPDITMGGGNTRTSSKLTDGYGTYLSPLAENYLTYTHATGKHDFSVMAGNTWSNFGYNKTLDAVGVGFSDYHVKNILLAANHDISTHTYHTGAYLSYFGRVNYQFDNRYIITANFRADGSPKFAPGNRWGYFPSAAIAWKMHEENWVKNLGVFDQLKLRAGWGQSGSDAIDDFMYLSKIWNLNVFYPFGNSGSKAYGATVIDNVSSKIKWETTTSRTIGLDMAFLKNRLTATVEYFDKSTKDILYAIPIPPSLGYGTHNQTGAPVINAASVDNRGFETLLGFRNRASDFNYAISGNYTYVYNEVTSLGREVNVDNSNTAATDLKSRTTVGRSIGYFYGFVADGIFSKAELDAANAKASAQGIPGQEYYQLATTSPGDVRFKDINGDGVIDWANDRMEIGRSIPKHYYGFSVVLGYKNFDFNMDFQGVAGAHVYNNFYEFQGGTQLGNVSAAVLDRWRNEQNPGNGTQPRAVNGDPAGNNRNSTLRLQKIDYLKLRQASLGYNLPKSILQKIKVENTRLYISAYNLYTFTGYTQGWDPDLNGGNNNNLLRSVDGLNIAPKPRSVVFGIQFNL